MTVREIMRKSECNNPVCDGVALAGCEYCENCKYLMHIGEYK